MQEKSVRSWWLSTAQFESSNLLGGWGRGRGRASLVVRASDSGARGRGFDPNSGHRVVSLSRTHLPPKSTGNTQEAVAPSQHDWKIVYGTFRIKPINLIWSPMLLSRVEQFTTVSGRLFRNLMMSWKKGHWYVEVLASQWYQELHA